MTRVLIADDHPIIVSGLEAILRGSDFELVGAVADGRAVEEAVDRCRPDILVLDVSMPGMSGVAVVEQLAERGRLPPTILLTAALSDADLLHAIQLGVAGIALKDGAHRQLLECLDTVRTGGRWIEPALIDRALNVATKSVAPDPLAVLGVRERTIAEHVGQGMRNREIAERLGINEGTVKVHLHRIYRKLSVASRTELALLIREFFADPSKRRI